MSVIMIPSKHIYDIQNDKVIDNDIDKVEVRTTTVVPDNHYGDSVYNEKFEPQNLGEPITNKSDSKGTSTNGTLNVSGTPNGYNIGAGTKIVDTYYNITIRIPKKQGNSVITKILTGTNAQTNEPFIGLYKRFGSEKIYYEEVPNCFTSGTATNVHNNRPYAFNFTQCENYNFTNLIQENNISNLTNRTVEFSIIGKNKRADEFVADWGTPQIQQVDDFVIRSLGTWTVSSDAFQTAVGAYEQTFNTIESDLSTISYVYETDEYVFYNIKVLFARTMYACCSAILLAPPISFGKTYPAKVVKIEQKVEQAEFTIYGDSIGIDFQDNTITIGDGKNVISFQGNELMQTTNTPSLQSQYNALLYDWNEGKESITLICGIADYHNYLEETFTVRVADKYYDRGQVIVLYPAIGLREGQDLLLENGSKIHIQYIDENKAYCSATPITELPEIGSVMKVKVIATLLISREGKDGLPMTFQIDDIIEPYKLGSNGRDNPISVKKDGTPKQFKVVSKGIKNDGVCLQVITAIEK